MTNKPILVTGAHRSGTTWVGKIVCHSPLVHYVHEPFNIHFEEYKTRPDYWFKYITSENEAELYDQIKELVTPRPLSPESRNGGKPLHREQRFLMKDPIALFSAEWLATRFNMDIVVMIRHPAAFVGSLTRLGWRFDFTHFLKQPRLMKDYLHPFEEEITKITRTPSDVFEQAILLWKLIYFVVDQYREKHKDWLYLRHEDLAVNPREGFQKVFEYLNIEFSKDIKKQINEHSRSTNEIVGGIYSIKRNSKAIVKKWKNAFTEEEIEKIRVGVGSLSTKFYSDNEW